MEKVGAEAKLFFFHDFMEFAWKSYSEMCSNYNKDCWKQSPVKNQYFKGLNH